MFVLLEPAKTFAEWKRQQSEWSGGLRRGSLEWKGAWAALVEETGDPNRVALDPKTGESWGYLWTFWDRGRWVHEFMHRMHPRTKRRWYVHIPATPGWSPEIDRPKPRQRRTLH